MRINLTNNPFLNQDISSPLALIFLMVLAFAVAWFTVATGQEIVTNAQNSPAFNIKKRMQKEMSDTENSNPSVTNNGQQSSN